MKRTGIWELIFALALAVVSFAASDDKKADVLLQAAMAKETVQGDLKGAIELYEKAVKEAGANRALAAKALIHMAECYQKMGDAESRKIYERVLRDYADQKEAVALARTRLGPTESAPRTRGMSSRLVWTLPSGAQIFGTVSHDGRYVPYTDWTIPNGNADLFVHDVVSGADRRLTNDVKVYGEQFAMEVTFSRDDKQLAYSWFNKDRYELRILGLEGTPAQRSRVLFNNEDVFRIWPNDWSPDGKWLAVQLQRKDRSAQIGQVAVQDGSLRVLKSVDWRGATKLFFSPDSKYLAYDLPGSDTGDQHDVFVLAIDGSRETPAVVHPSNDVLMGWSPDGRRLLFASDRSGSAGLWGLAFTDGKIQGTPEPIKADITGASMGMTNGGALYSVVHYPSFSSVLRSDVQIATFDFAAGKFLSPPVAAVQAFVGANNNPSWSPDGKYLAFLSRRSGKNTIIAVLSRETGQLRELRTGINPYGQEGVIRWSPDGLSLAIQAIDSNGRQAIFRIDARTGEATPIALSTREEFFSGPIWSPDGKKMYYSRMERADRSVAVVERDLSSEIERVVVRGLKSFDLSPDGRYFAAFKEATLVLVPSGGGEASELMRAEQPFPGTSDGRPQMRVLMWAPDSRSIFVARSASANHREVWKVALDGSQPHKLDLNIDGMTPDFSVHPDGRQIAFAITEPAKRDEVWVLENFLPNTRASK